MDVQALFIAKSMLKAILHNRLKGHGGDLNILPLQVIMNLRIYRVIEPAFLQKEILEYNIHLLIQSRHRFLMIQGIAENVARSLHHLHHGLGISHQGRHPDQVQGIEQEMRIHLGTQGRHLSRYQHSFLLFIDQPFLCQLLFQSGSVLNLLDGRPDLFLHPVRCLRNQGKLPVRRPSQIRRLPFTGRKPVKILRHPSHRPPGNRGKMNQNTSHHHCHHPKDHGHDNHLPENHPRTLLICPSGICRIMLCHFQGLLLMKLQAIDHIDVDIIPSLRPFHHPGQALLLINVKIIDPPDIVLCHRHIPTADGKGLCILFQLLTQLKILPILLIVPLPSQLPEGLFHLIQIQENLITHGCPVGKFLLQPVLHRHPVDHRPDHRQGHKKKSRSQ